MDTQFIAIDAVTGFSCDDRITSAIKNTISQAMHFSQTKTPELHRKDGGLGAISRFREHRNDSFVRNDAFNIASSTAMVRELEYKYQEVIREEYKDNTALNLFNLDQSVPVGARYHTVKRLYQYGEAAWHRAGQQFPTVSFNLQEENFPVRYVVTSFETEFFTQQSMDYAGIAKAAEDARCARDVINEFLNKKYWEGDDNVQIWGILNYPYAFKKLFSVTFNDALSADDCLKALHNFVNVPAARTFGKKKPNTLAVTTEMYEYLATKKFTYTDRTVLELFTAQNPTVKNVVVADELVGAGPGGVDCMFAFKADRMGVSCVNPLPFTILPVQTNGLENRTICVASSGGVIERDAAANIIGYYET